jgi:predicted MFS family arabinose efflux permease
MNNIGAQTSAELTVEQRTPWGQHALLFVVFFLIGMELYLVAPLLPEMARSLEDTIAAVAMVVTAYAGVYALALLGLRCICGGVFYSSQLTFLSSADPSQRATVIAWNNSMLYAGTAVGTTALGFVVAGSVSFATITAALGVAALTAAALLLLTNCRAGAMAQII